MINDAAKSAIDMIPQDLHQMLTQRGALRNSTSNLGYSHHRMPQGFTTRVTQQPKPSGQPATCGHQDRQRGGSTMARKLNFGSTTQQDLPPMSNTAAKMQSTSV